MRHLIRKLTSSCRSATVKNVKTYSDDEYAEAFSFLMAFEEGEETPSEAKHRRWLNNLLLVDYGGSKKLVRRGSRLEVVKQSELFDKINEVHLASGHAGRDKLTKQLSKKFFNVSYSLINMYLVTCAT